jgi:hypothetical protein
MEELSPARGPAFVGKNALPSGKTLSSVPKKRKPVLRSSNFLAAVQAEFLPQRLQFFVFKSEKFESGIQLDRPS